MKFRYFQFQNWILMILGGPWPARAGNLDIPIGILRFLSLPGPHGSLQNSKKLQIPTQIALFHSKTGFSASGAKKIAPERYVYVGFWAGAANVDFWSPRCVFDAQNIKFCILQDSMRFYGIPQDIAYSLQPASRGLQLKDILKDILKDFLKDFLKEFLYIGYP